jgi:predicted ribosomally synthesized peptide with nif11-like leader
MDSEYVSKIPILRVGVADRTDLQEKVNGGADLVALGKENGYEFSQEELEAGWEELQESDEGLTEFELDVVAGGLGCS